MQDNRGQTLAELLIAFSISAVLLAGLSYLLFMGLRMYDRTDANIRVQNEIQSALQLLTDHMMEAKSVCMEAEAADPKKQCLMIDDIFLQETAGHYQTYFKGEAVVVMLEEEAVYLVSFPNEDYPALEDESKAFHGYAKVGGQFAQGPLAVEDARMEILQYMENQTAEERRKWLLAEHITGCEISLTAGTKLEHVVIPYKNPQDYYYYQEPLAFQLRVSTRVKAQGGISERTIEEPIAVRNRLHHVFVKKDGSMQEYLRK